MTTPSKEALRAAEPYKLPLYYNFTTIVDDKSTIAECSSREIAQALVYAANAMQPLREAAEGARMVLDLLDRIYNFTSLERKSEEGRFVALQAVRIQRKLRTALEMEK